MQNFWTFCQWALCLGHSGAGRGAFFILSDVSGVFIPSKVQESTSIGCIAWSMPISLFIITERKVAISEANVRYNSGHWHRYQFPVCRTYIWVLMFIDQTFIKKIELENLSPKSDTYIGSKPCTTFILNEIALSLRMKVV
uniref:Uncharacterized protein n=1 Tax=Megaselia scalaris TaxID=36166 RepID=T1GXS6_MEGSC